MSDIASMVASSTQLSQQNVREQVQVAVLKQAQDMAQQGAMQLLNSVTETALATTGANPSEQVGATIDVRV
ncbi:MAG: putative motility protein [Marinobacter sp.]